MKRKKYRIAKKYIFAPVLFLKNDITLQFIEYKCIMDYILKFQQIYKVISPYPAILADY